MISSRIVFPEIEKQKEKIKLADYTWTKKFHI
jgi:hypothetical protein